MPSTDGVDARLARDAIVRACNRGLGSRELFAQVSARLRPVVPYAAAGWLSTDPATMLYTDAVVENIERSVHLRLFENELVTPDFLKFEAMRAGGATAATLTAATDGHPELSARHTRIHRPEGLGHELRAVFTTGEACWGVACLTRAAGEPDFSRAEVEFVASLAAHVAHGLRVALLRTEVAESRAEDAPGMIVLGPGGEIESATESAERWLAEFPAERPGDLELPSVVLAVALRARAALEGSGDLVPRARVRLPGGRWLLVHAAGLRGAEPGRTAVMIEPARRAELAPIVVELFGLTDRERQVTELLVRGLATDEIAQSLWLSRHTVRDHVKTIFAKLDVASRPELTAKLLAEQEPAPG
jgi:DNA-binding CsgD family transcriptional regulator